MVVVIVLAVLLTVAVPSFEAVMNANRLAGASNEMMASLQTRADGGGAAQRARCAVPERECQ